VAGNLVSVRVADDATAIIGSMMTRTMIVISLTTLLSGHPFISAEGQQGSESAQNSPYTMRVTKSEVVVDLIAADAKNHPVLNAYIEILPAECLPTRY
jgi:hypothetical protein